MAFVQKAGLCDLEREATFAIERGKTKRSRDDWKKNPASAAEDVFRYVAFDHSTAHGCGRHGHSCSLRRFPMARITGIESPALLRPGAPNYWAAAWAARDFVSKRASKVLPVDAIGLAVNSINGRSQNQLHIHVDCMRIDVRSALRRSARHLSSKWTPFRGGILGHHYLARRYKWESLHRADPFKFLASGVRGVRRHMGQWTLVVASVSLGTRRNGYILLADHSKDATSDQGHGEELLDPLLSNRPQAELVAPGNRRIPRKGRRLGRRSRGQTMATIHSPTAILRL